MDAVTALNEGTLTVKIAGELDVNTVGRLRALLDPVVDQPGRGVIVDLENLRLIDSSGVGILVYLFRRARASGRAFVVRGASRQPLSILRLMKLDRVFTEAEAAAG